MWIEVPLNGIKGNVLRNKKGLLQLDTPKLRQAPLVGFAPFAVEEPAPPVEVLHDRLNVIAKQFGVLIRPFLVGVVNGHFRVEHGTGSLHRKSLS